MNTKSNKVQRGDKWSRLSYGTVTGTPIGAITITNEKGKTWDVGRSIFEDEFDTIQYDSVEQVTRTEMAEVVMKNARVVMLVEFRKQAAKKDIVDTVMDILSDPMKYMTAKGDTISKTKVSKALKVPTEGQKRTMIGRHNGFMNTHGRIDFTDMEVTSGHNLRQIDPRTIERVIVGGVCYELK